MNNVRLVEALRSQEHGRRGMWNVRRSGDSEMTSNARCQSCGMPLKADPIGGGTDADRSLSNEYCSFCFQNGKLINPEMTIDEMRALIIEKLGQKGYPRFIARFFTIGLNRLKRWRDHG